MTGLKDGWKSRVEKSPIGQKKRPAHCSRGRDFSNGVRGKFYRKGAKFRLPVYLDEKVQDDLTAKADAKRVELADLVNDMLRKSIDLVEMAR